MEYSYMSYGNRKNVRDIEGILKTYKFASIGASSSFVLDISEMETTWKKYLPFNSVTIINNGGTAIDVLINESSDRYLHLPNGVIQTYAGVGIWSLKVTNLDAVNPTTANQIVAQFERLGMTSDKLSQRIAENPILKILLGA